MPEPDQSDTPNALTPSPNETDKGAQGPLSNVPSDLISGLVVFLVALPLCLGIALASGAPLMSGLLSGIIGGIVVGWLSGSHTSVSGPAAGLTAIVLAQVAILESFDKFLLAVAFAGVIQIGFGIARAGALSAFFPSSVIKGLLAAIGVILILKQIPHVVGHDSDPEGDMAFLQTDNENTFSEILAMVGDMHQGAALIGITSIVLLVIWGKLAWLKRSVIPGPLVVVLFGVAMKVIFDRVGGAWLIESSHLVDIPLEQSLVTYPDFTAWSNPAVYVAAFTIAIVASLETLLNLEAVDKLDAQRRSSPPNRELIAQGTGNLIAGMVGGLPVTSVIVRGSVNVAAGSKTKLSAIFHGILLVLFVVFFPEYLNEIPLAALAAILLVTGFKLASPQLFRQMWSEGRYQFAPFLITLLSIVFTDLLIGILIGLAVSALFILNSSLRQPIRRIVETHLDGEVTHVVLSNQVSFLNRAALDRLFDQTKPGTHLMIDATESDYIDPDILSLIRDFDDNIGPSRGVTVSLKGFRDKYLLNDVVRFADYSTRELQDRATPAQILRILQEGNERFRSGNRLTRDFSRQVQGTAGGQNPLAVVLSCIDSRVPAELILDVGIGDIFSVRVAGNVLGTKSVASIEYGVEIAGVKLILVVGHTRCGAVNSSIQLLSQGTDVAVATGCSHLGSIVDEIAESVTPQERRSASDLSEEELEQFADQVAKRNVLRTVDEVLARSSAIARSAAAGRVLVVGSLYDVKTGRIEFFLNEAKPPELAKTIDRSAVART